MRELRSRYKKCDKNSEQRRGIDEVPFFNEAQMDTVFVVLDMFTLVLVFVVFVFVCLVVLMQFAMGWNIEAQQPAGEVRYDYVAYGGNADRTKVTYGEHEQQAFSFGVQFEH